MNWLRDPTDDSRDYYLRSGPFVLCECEAACEAFDARQAA